MKNLIPPSMDASQVYEDLKNNARNSDKQSRLKCLEHYVFARYEEYSRSTPNLEGISASKITQPEDHDALSSCYSRHKDGYLEGHVVALIIKVQSAQHKNKCPYCGMDKPRTIDHYLPKSQFPEFSVYPPNLIPCCAYCNSKKNDIWVHSGERVYLNLYYDVLPPDEKFLFTSFQFDSNAMIATPKVTFELINTGNISAELFDLIESHYNRLDLLRQYASNVEEELSNIFDKVVNEPNVPVDAHIDDLQREFRMLVRKYGINYWKASLYDCLINSSEFFRRARNLPHIVL